MRVKVVVDAGLILNHHARELGGGDYQLWIDVHLNNSNNSSGRAEQAPRHAHELCSSIQNMLDGVLNTKDRDAFTLVLDGFRMHPECPVTMIKEDDLIKVPKTSEAKLFFHQHRRCWYEWGWRWLFRFPFY